MPAVFHTLSTPPVWLQEAFNRAGAQLRVDILVISPPDLPGFLPSSRIRFLKNRCREIFGTDPDRTFGRQNLACAATDSTGYIVMDGNQFPRGGTSDFPFEQEFVSEAPGRAIVAIPPTDSSAASLTAAFLSVSQKNCAAFTNIQPGLMTFFHEIGHYDNRHPRGRSGRLTPCEDEYAADLFAMRMAEAPDAGYFCDLRTLDALLSPVIDQAVPYWHPLSLAHGTPVADPMAERAAVLEMHHRAGWIGLPRHVDRMSPREFLIYCLEDSHALSLRECYDPKRWRAQAHGVLLQRLDSAASRRRPCIFPLTKELETRAIEAAHRLVPGVFGESTKPRPWVGAQP